MTKDDWGKLNRSELAAIAQEFDREAHRGLPEEVLIELIESSGLALPERKVNKKRLQIVQHIIKNWAALCYQVSCPAKSQDPRACFRCQDLQVACCTIENMHLFGKD
jgi:hypothetical protein